MRREDSSIEECPESESELGKKGSTKDGSVGKEGGRGESRAYEATSEVYTGRAAVLAYVDVIEEWEWVHADTARVIV